MIEFHALLPTTIFLFSIKETVLFIDFRVSNRRMLCLINKEKTLTSMRFDCLYVYHIYLHHFVDKKKEKTTTTKTKDKTYQT